MSHLIRDNRTEPLATPLDILVFVCKLVYLAEFRVFWHLIIYVVNCCADIFTHLSLNLGGGNRKFES